MTQAREALSGRWGLAVGTFLVYTLIVALLSSYSSLFIRISDIGDISRTGYVITISSSILLLLIIGALEFGAATFALAIARKKEAKLNMIFCGFNHYGKTLGLCLLMALFVFLWMLLLIIPGIIAALSYSMAYFIMSDDPNIGVMEAIDKSKKMMYGYKWKYFCLGLRFIGWMILGILSLGIGLLWIIPYIYISYAKFYEDLKANSVEVQ